MPISPSSINGYIFNSEAEKKIYIESVNSGFFNNSDKYLFHSLNLANTGDIRIKAEIDFVYLDAQCLLFFEVKGGEVKYDSFTNEWWVLNGTSRGDPFKQAYSGLFQTRDVLLPDLFKSRSVPGRLVFGIGVIFPDSLKPDEFHKNSVGHMEFDPELILDFSELKRKGFISFINRAKSYWSDHPQFQNRIGLSKKEMSVISNFFRQNLHFRLPVSEVLRKEDNDIIRFTNMQTYVLENLKYNQGKGGIIIGGPGTGKTILAIELFKRKIEEGKKTLFVCFNVNLSYHLKSIIPADLLKEQSDIYNIHKIYTDKSFIEQGFPDNDSSHSFWSMDLPLLFVRNLCESKRNYYDYIIIDEGQDILNEYHFDVLNALLKGGLDSGNWAMFMDKDYQNIYNSEAEEFYGYLKEAYPCFVNVLNLNCRNTVTTIKIASIQTGFPEMPCLRTDEAWKSQIKFFSSATEMKNQINDLVIRMEKDGIEKENITVLCFSNSQIQEIKNSNPAKYIESAFPVKGKIILSTIHAYKGLENKFIISCGPQNFDPNDKNQMSLIYIANTRATSQSTFFLDKKYESIIIDRITSLI